MKILDKAGNIKYNQTTGEPMNVSEYKNPYLFQSRRLDSWSGHYYFRNRYYDPDTGRFLTRDPARDDSLGNLYAFVNNNPVNYVDPWGLTKQEVILEWTAVKYQFSRLIHGLQMIEEGLRNKWFGVYGKGMAKVEREMERLPKSIYDLIKALKKTWIEFKHDVKIFKEVKEKSHKIMLSEIHIKTFDAVLSYTPKKEAELKKMISTYIQFTASKTGAHLVGIGQIQAIKMWLSSGPKAFAGLKAAPQLSKYFSKEASRLFTRVSFLGTLLRFVPYAAVTWEAIEVRDSKDPLLKLKIERNLKTLGVVGGVELASVFLARKGIITLAAKQALTKTVSGPIGWTILLGQTWQWIIIEHHWQDVREQEWDTYLKLRNMSRNNRLKLLEKTKALEKQYKSGFFSPDTVER